jgi:hypothetical protein
MDTEILETEDAILRQAMAESLETLRNETKKAEKIVQKCKDSTPDYSEQIEEKQLPMEQHFSNPSQPPRSGMKLVTVIRNGWIKQEWR